MLAYILLTVLLLLLGYWEAASPEGTRAPITWAALLVILFAGLRFETGTDWLEYETLMAVTSPLFGGVPTYLPPNLLVEPGFSLLVSVLNALGLPFQFLLFISALFSVGVLALFSSRYSSHPVLVILWYCGFALLLGQMAAIRQVIAYAFLLLAFMTRDKGYWGRSLLLAAASVTMHVFAAVLIPIVYLRVRPPRSILVLALCGFGLLATLVGINIVSLLAGPISSLVGGIAGVKLETYTNIAFNALSVSSLALLAWHGAVLLLINRPQLAEWNHPVVRCAIYATIWSLVSHTYLATLPAVWNRVMLLSMPLEALALLRCYGDLLTLPRWRTAIPAGAWILSVASIGYTLSQESALPYLPYQSAVYVWVTGDIGDGRLRYQIEQANLDRRVDEQSRP